MSESTINVSIAEETPISVTIQGYQCGSHRDLLDMPDLAGVVADHDARIQIIQSQKWVMGETPTPAPDGVTTTFYAADNYVANKFILTKNGLIQSRDDDFTENGEAASFSFIVPPLSGDRIRAFYLRDE